MKTQKHKGLGRTKKCIHEKAWDRPLGSCPICGPYK